jgi:hypothetical protein
MIENAKPKIIKAITKILNIFGATREEAPEVLTETLREYQEYFVVPKEVDHV